jgi:3-methyladenine DNA glycosylase/8-oxoguanine DNA glycosylase
MVKLAYSFQHEITPIPPYNFKLTVKKPAGWSLFTPFEVYERRSLWTATHLNSILVGIKLTSRGTTRRPRIAATLFLKSKPESGSLEGIKRSLAYTLGADEDLTEFYDLARTDSILRLVIDDLYGMHNTAPSTIFPDAALAILLQMAPFKRSDEMMGCFITKYGEVAEFDGKKIPVWPRPKRIAKLDAPELAKACKLGYRAKYLVNLARKLELEAFPTIEELEALKPAEAKKLLLDLPGIGDYSADIINPHGGFPIDVWSADVFGKLFFGEEPTDTRKAIEGIKKEGLRRWGNWSWMAFFYVVNDLENLSRKLETQLRLI